jgi:hypothetical protein
MLLASAVGYLSYLNRQFQLDDALIYQRYFRNVLEGNGLVFNLGERVNALTSPLFSYLSIATAYLVGDFQIASVVFAGATLLVALGVWWRLFATTSGPLAATLGLAFTTLFPFLYVTLGMETSLFLFLIGLCFYLFETANYSLLAIGAALLLLTRPEGVFLLLALTVEHLRQHRPLPSWKVLIAPAVLLAGHFLFTWIYYGSPFSETAMVKIIQGRSGFWGPWPPFARVGYQLDWFFDGDRVRMMALGSLALIGAVASRRTTLFWVGTLFLLLLTAFYVAFSLPSYHWYYAPYYMLGLFWAGVGAVWLWKQARRVQTPLVRGATSTVVVAFVTLLLAQGATGALETVGRSKASHPYRQIGEWLAEYTKPDARVAAMEIGFMGWYSNRTLIDIVGLVTPENARFLAEGRFDAWLEHHDPDYIVTHDPPWRLERAAKAAVRSGSYRPVEAIDVSGYQLLERTPDAGFGPLAETLDELRTERDPEFRSRVLDAILDRQLGPVVELRSSDVIAANLSPDHWTRGTSPAAIVIQNGGVAEMEVILRLSCLAGPSDLPMTAFLDDGDTVREIAFSAAGTQRINLAAVPGGSRRLIAIWTDKAWQPQGRDRRWLGVNIDFPD